MKEILPKLMFLHLGIEITMSCDQHSHVYPYGLFSADALDFILLQDAQELALHMQRHIADLVKRRWCHVRPARTCPHVAPAAPVNEPFSWPNSSDSISSAGTAAQSRVIKGPRSSRATLVQRSCHHSLTSSGFAQNAHTCSLAATRSTCAITRRIALALPDNLGAFPTVGEVAGFLAFADAATLRRCRP